MQESQSGLVSAEKIIPARVVVGVTGHRKLDIQPWLIEEIQAALDKIKKMAPSLSHTPLSFTVLSPLAEGADRLVVKEVLKLPGATLDVILPFEKKDYIQDFMTEESRTEFNELLIRSSNVKTLYSKGSRSHAYEKVGRYVVDQCDVLVALWNGKPAAGQGGTEEIVQYARQTRCPLIVIGTEKAGETTVDLGSGLDPRRFINLDRYNSEYVDAVRLKKEIESNRENFYKITKNTGFSFSRVRETLDYALYHYVSADQLAVRYQKLNNRTESLVYVLALAALVIASAQMLFFQGHPAILFAEAGLMLVVLILVFISRRQEWHTRWIDYRFLSERFRTSIYMALADADIATLRPPRHLSLAYSTKDWMITAFLSFWNRRPRFGEVSADQLGGLRALVCESWLQDQVRYHERAEKRYFNQYHIMTIGSYILFGLTICAAAFHVFFHGGYLSEIFSFGAIVFPAIASTISAVRIHRDYLKNSKRSFEMKSHLEEIKERMLSTQDITSFIELLKEVEEMVLYENLDWRVVVRFQSPEVPV